MTSREASKKGDTGCLLASLACRLIEAGFSFQDSELKAIEVDRQSVKLRINAMCAELLGEENFRP